MNYSYNLMHICSEVKATVFDWIIPKYVWPNAYVTLVVCLLFPHSCFLYFCHNIFKKEMMKE